MSWSRLERRLRGAGAGILLMLLAGCGFSPVYGEKSATVGAQAALAGVDVAPISGMLGYDLRRNLLDQIQPNGETGTMTHRLDIDLMPGLAGVLVEPDASITRYNYVLVANYRLIDLASSQVVLEGSSRSITGYNVVQSEYATLVSKQDAERRAAALISEDLALKLALYFNK